MEKRILLADLTEESCAFIPFETSLSGLALAFSLYEEYGEASFVVCASGSDYNLYAGSYPVSMVFTSPVTGKATYSFTSCSFGSSLVSKNIDAIVITGTARRLSYLSITGSGSELFQCEQLRFSAIPSFFSIVSNDPQDRLLAIGEAGERGVRLAAIYSSTSLEVASEGAGAVWGNRNLKGILVSGKGDVRKENRKFDRALKKSKLVKAIRRDGSAALVERADKAGWLPVEYFSGTSDPRVVHLEGEEIRARYSAVAISCAACPVACHRNTKDGELLPGYEDLMTLGANAGWYSPEKVRALAESCFEAGLSKRDLGELIAYHRIEGDEKVNLKDMSFEKALQLIKLIGEKKGIGEEFAKGFAAFPDALSAGGLPCVYDLRGSLALAVFETFGESELPYADMFLSLSKRLSSEQMGIVSAYLRVYTHAMMALSLPPFLMVPLYFEKKTRFMLPAEWSIRAVFDSFRIFGLKKTDLVKPGLESMEAFDRLRGGEYEIPSYFLNVMGEEGRTERIKYSSLMLSYRKEIERLKTEAVGKSS